jgi:hypothetical protein
MYRQKDTARSVGRQCVDMFISTPPPVESELRAPHGPPRRRSGGGAGERRCIKTGDADDAEAQGGVSPCTSEREQSQSGPVV